MSPAVVDELVARGVRTVIDLRSEQEARRQGYGPLDRHVQEGRVDLVACELALSPAFQQSPAGRDPYSHLPQVYMELLDASGERLAAALAAAAGRGGVLLHCALGKDRTGAAVASIAAAMGLPDDAIVADYMRTDAAFAGLVGRLSGDAAYPEFADPDWDALAMRPSAAQGLLDLLAARGGAAEYWARHGLDSTVLRRLLTDTVVGEGTAAAVSSGSGSA
jgi:protein-tyrosine phosphatase